MSSPVRARERVELMSDSDYPGVLRQVSDGWRLVVSPDGRRYRLQALVQVAYRDEWASLVHLQGMTLAVLLQRAGDEVEGLASACEGLPENPALAAPEFVAKRKAQVARVYPGRAAAAAARDQRRAARAADAASRRRQPRLPAG